MAWREAGSSAALGLLALFALIASAGMEIGSVTQPGPGFFPLVLSAALVLVALALLVNAFRSGGAAPEATMPPERTAPWKLLASVGTFAVYIALFERLGFVVATAGFLSFLFGALARYRWPVAVGAGVALTIAAYLVFNTWLQVRLPHGVLGRW
jgi:putative tricarboxylic transport membrane protein